jgi:HK97 family phage major capsid protein
VRTLKDIHAAMAKLETEAKAIRSQAEENTPEKGVDGKGLLSLTAEDEQRLDAIYAEFDTLKAEGEALEQRQERLSRIDAMSEYLDGSPGRQTQPDPVAPNGPNAGRGGAANLQRTVEFRGRTLSFAPGSQAHALLDPQYEAAFANYLAGGPMVNVPQAALQTTEDSRGGYVAPMRFTTELIQALDDAVFMRAAGPGASAVGAGHVDRGAQPGHRSERRGVDPGGPPRRPHPG